MEYLYIVSHKKKSVIAYLHYFVGFKCRMCCQSADDEFHVADDNQGVRQVSAAGHRVQDSEHQLPDDLPRSGAVFTKQVPHAAS